MDSVWRFTIELFPKSMTFLSEKVREGKSREPTPFPNSAKLKRPRRVMMLVKAGSAVDEFIEQLLPHLEPGDIIIDGGN